MRPRHATMNVGLALAVGTMALAGVAGVAQARPSGSHWSIQPSPNPPGATSSSLAALACAGDDTCTAVGDYIAGAGYLTLAERWDGSAWTIEPTPNPDGALDSILTGIACPAPSTCLAVGYSVNPRAAVRALVEQWDGTAWTIVPTPRPHRSSGEGLQTVSCAEPTDCTAVGGFAKHGINAQSQPLAEHWDGSAWTIEPTPNPRAENGSSLTGVSCPDPSICEAAGNYAYADVSQSVFAFGWNGKRWAMQKQPNPGAGDANAESAASCSSARACTEVGLWTDAGGRAYTLVERWDGTSWKLQRSPNPHGFVFSEMNGVSCAGASACTAVGDWSKSDNNTPLLTLAEGWDGTAWRIQATPNPKGATFSSLDGVACPSPTACVAVGSSYANGVTRSLVEAYSA